MMPAGSNRFSRLRHQSTASHPIKTPQHNTGIRNQCAVRSQAIRKPQAVRAQNKNEIARLVRFLLPESECSLLFTSPVTTLSKLHYAAAYRPELGAFVTIGRKSAAPARNGSTVVS